MVNWCQLYGANVCRGYGLWIAASAWNTASVSGKEFSGWKVGLVMKRDFWLGFC